MRIPTVQYFKQSLRERDHHVRSLRWWWWLPHLEQILDGLILSDLVPQNVHLVKGVATPCLKKKKNNDLLHSETCSPQVKKRVRSESERWGTYSKPRRRHFRAVGPSDPPSLQFTVDGNRKKKKRN